MENRGEGSHPRVTYFGRKCTPIIMPPRYSPQQWTELSSSIHKCTTDGVEWADKSMAKSFRLVDEKMERRQRSQQRVQFTLEQRLKDIQLWVQQLTHQSEQISRQLDDLATYHTRLENAFRTIPPIVRTNLHILQLREGRVEIDLVDDEPQSEMHSELNLLQRWQSTLEQLRKAIDEQMRVVRKFWLQLSRQLSDKKSALEIDTLTLRLNEHSLNVKRIPGSSDLNAQLSWVDDESEWEEQTRLYDISAQKLLLQSQNLQVEVESSLRQLCDHFQRQVCQTNGAFEKRLAQLREAKSKMERDHHQISIGIREMENLLDKLGKSLVDKESALALTEMRIALRSQRPNQELVRDVVQRTLQIELGSLRDSAHVLSVEFTEMKKALRSLLSQQIALEDEINVKMKSIAIDETQVLPLRRTIHIQQH